MQVSERNVPTYRLSVVPCNHPKTTAYSIGWDHRIDILHAHTVGEDLLFYQSSPALGESTLWIYVPLRKNELVTEIWKLDGPLFWAPALLVCRVFLVGDHLLIGFQLVTNLGHSKYLGVQPLKPLDRNKWVLLDRPSKTISHIYPEMTRFGVRGLGFETPQPTPTEPPLVEWPTSPHPYCRPREYFAWNKAKLDDVIELIPYRRHYRGITSIAGVLLRYADGEQTALGLVRLDSLGAVMRVDVTRKLWLGFVLTNFGPCVASIMQAQEKPNLSSCAEWFGVDWCGDLEWWSSSSQCQLSYRGHLSPKTGW
jgi:hypothetical protein